MNYEQLPGIISALSGRVDQIAPRHMACSVRHHDHPVRRHRRLHRPDGAHGRRRLPLKRRARLDESLRAAIQRYRRDAGRGAIAGRWADGCVWVGPGGDRGGTALQRRERRERAPAAHRRARRGCDPRRGEHLWRRCEHRVARGRGSAAGEVLVSATVRELARTSAGVSFEDRGERELKGVDDPVRVWAVVEE